MATVFKIATPVYGSSQFSPQAIGFGRSLQENGQKKS
jgi:hypothetical protein